MSSRSGTNLSKVFDQYLRTIQIPVLEYRIEGSAVSYRWSNVVPGFNMPIGVELSGGKYRVIHPTEQWQTAKLKLANPADFKVDPDYYVVTKEVPRGP